MMQMEMVAAVFLSIHKNCITILMHFYINLFLMHSFFKRKWYFASSYWFFSVSFEGKRGTNPTDSSWSASLFWCISSIYYIIFLMHSFSFLWNKQGKWPFLHHLCDSFLLDLASLLWCISSYFNENTTHLTDSLYLILHHISDASFSFKVNRGCYYIIFLMQFYSLRWDWLIYHGITVFFNGNRGQQVKSYDSYLFEWGWFLLKEWDGFIVRKQNDRTVFLNENNCLF